MARLSRLFVQRFATHFWYAQTFATDGATITVHNAAFQAQTLGATFQFGSIFRSGATIKVWKVAPSFHSLLNKTIRKFKNLNFKKLPKFFAKTFSTSPHIF